MKPKWSKSPQVVRERYKDFKCFCVLIGIKPMPFNQWVNKKDFPEGVPSPKN
jgi:hypothetical protein